MSVCSGSRRRQFAPYSVAIEEEDENTKRGNELETPSASWS